MPKLLPDEAAGRHVGRNLSRETQGFLARLPGAQASDYIPVRFKPDFRPIREIFLLALPVLILSGAKSETAAENMPKSAFGQIFRPPHTFHLRIAQLRTFDSLRNVHFNCRAADCRNFGAPQPCTGGQCAAHTPCGGLDQKRTPSQNSRVGPSVTSTFCLPYHLRKARAGQPEKFRAILPACLVLPRHRRCPQCLA